MGIIGGVAYNVYITCCIGSAMGASDRSPASPCLWVLPGGGWKTQLATVWACNPGWSPCRRVPGLGKSLPVAAGGLLLSPVNWGLEAIKWAEAPAVWPMDKPVPGSPLRNGVVAHRPLPSRRRRGPGLRSEPPTAGAGRAGLCDVQRGPMVVHGDRDWDCIRRHRRGAIGASSSRHFRHDPRPVLRMVAFLLEVDSPTPSGPAAGGLAQRIRHGSPATGAQPEHPARYLVMLTQFVLALQAFHHLGPCGLWSTH